MSDRDIINELQEYIAEMWLCGNLTEWLDDRGYSEDEIKQIVCGD